MKIWKDLAKIAAHILFWSFVLYRFVNYAFLRPICSDHLYKEIICCLLIILMVYFHYFFLIPYLLQKGKKLLYWIITFTLLLVISCTELVITWSDIKFHTINYLPSKDYPRYLFNVGFLIFMRDACFFAFFFLLKLYDNLKIINREEKKAIAQQKDSIIVSTSLKDNTIVDIDDISYFSHQRNYTTIHLLSGDSFRQYTPLKEYYELLPPNTALQISRNCIVMLKHVVGYNNIYIRIRTGANEQMDISIPVRRKQEIASLLQSIGIPKINITVPSDPVIA